MDLPKANYKCWTCEDTGWEIYELPAPSPPYLEGAVLEYGRRCSCTVTEQK